MLGLDEGCLGRRDAAIGEYRRAIDAGFWRDLRPRKETIPRRNSLWRKLDVSTLNSRSNVFWRTRQSCQGSLRGCAEPGCRKNELYISGTPGGVAETPLEADGPERGIASQKNNTMFLQPPRHAQRARGICLSNRHPDADESPSFAPEAIPIIRALTPHSAQTISLSGSILKP
jgi:hypothetical protein